VALAVLAWPSFATAQVSADPTALAFGDVRVGTTTPVDDGRITLTNIGVDPVQFTACAIAPASDFTLQSCPVGNTIGPGGTSASVIRFAPQTRGAQAATLTIDFEIQSTPPVTASVTVALSGTGAAPAMVVTVVPAAPEPLDFGSSVVGVASPTTFTIRVQNTGNDELNATLAESGNTADWTFEPPATSFLVAAGGVRNIVATFTPQAAGPRAASATVTDVDGLSTPPSVAIDFIGNGEPPIAGITVSPTALAFGVVDVQLDEPVPGAITVTNPGNVDLQITAMSLEALDGTPYVGEQFQVLTTAPLSIPAGGQGQIDVLYRPALESAGDFAKLVLQTNAPEAGEVEVTMSGRGVDRHIEVTPLRIDFAPTYRNPETPPEVTIEVQNTGESPLVLGELMAEGEAADSFVVVGDLADVIEPQDSSSVVVQFHPRAAPEGPLQAALVIVNDDDSSPIVRIDLSGIGILPPIVSTYTAIEWGSVAVGLELPPPGSEPFTLRNDSGEETFLVQEVRVVDNEGRALDAVRVTGFTDPVELAPGESLLLEVAFAPRRGGVIDGAIEVLVGPDPEPVVSVAVGGVAVETDARGGAGCSAGIGQARPSSLAALCLVAAAVLFASRRRRRGAGLLLVAALLGAPDALAQVQVSRDLDLASFRPLHAVDPLTVTVETTDVGEAGSGALGVSFDHARNPLILRAADGEMVDHPVLTRSTFELAGAFAFGGRFEVAAVVPLLSQTGDPPNFSGIAPAEGTALGDIRMRGRAFLGANGRVRFGAAAELTMPTALDTPFAGAAGPSAMARGLADYRRGRLLLAFNAGAVMRERIRLADIEQGHQAIYGAAAVLQALPRLHGIAEVTGSIGLSGGPAGTRPLEAIVAARLRVIREVGLLAGVGRGVLAGVGAPELRYFVALGWSPQARPIAGPDDDPRALTDDDRDGVVKRDDRCPDEMEDLDGLKDEDGCLDRDDDGDGVPDAVDRCPRTAEDADQFEDGDGCPDLDNDADQVRDRADRCPNEAEDADSYEDEDGCPEPDNDSDGVNDGVDRCPLEKETINGSRDDDGCPDPGAGLVLVTADKIEVLEPIRFRGDGSTMARRTQRLLGQVAATLRAHREITRLRIRAHVHPRGSGDEALSVARAEAVRRWLVEWGIEASRLEGVGYGSRQLMMSGDRSRARTMNDRVEFEIVERRR
jgi:outer membrane protein OmpA-like peptidoglycan-associated protein